jgi:hypothetical protein
MKCLKKIKSLKTSKSVLEKNFMTFWQFLADIEIIEKIYETFFDVE